MWCNCARPCVIAIRFSLRVSTQRTGLPVCFAAHATTICSLSTPILAPNPPPTSGATTRIASGGSPIAVKISRASWAFCVDAQTVSLPSLKAAAVARPSIGRQATRWLTMSPSTTTSQPSKIAVVADVPAAPDADVGARVGEQQAVAGERAVDRGHRGQHLVVHADQLGRVLALVRAVGEHDRHRLADEPHPVHREQRLGPLPAERHRPLGRRLVRSGHLAARRLGRGQVGHVRRGQHRDDARLRERLRLVYASYQRMRHRRANERGPHRTRQLRFPQVVYVDAARGQQPRVLRTDDPRAQNAHKSSAATAFHANLHRTMKPLPARAYAKLHARTCAQNMR